MKCSATHSRPRWNEMAPPIKDLTDQRFGKLLVIDLHPTRTNSGGTRWDCRCDCGNAYTAASGDLKSGGTVSCGCHRRRPRPDIAQRQTKHGHAKGTRASRTYVAWRGMRDRCLNPNSCAYKYYGARGITICARWSKFKNFLADMGECPAGLTLERKNNNRGYTPKNCHWATWEQQIHNRRPQSEWFHPPGPRR